LSDVKYLFSVEFELENQKKIPFGGLVNGYYITGDHPQITPQIVKNLILEYEKQNILKAAIKSN
jgi:hypothetical protein